MWKIPLWKPKNAELSHSYTGKDKCLQFLILINPTNNKKKLKFLYTNIRNVSSTLSPQALLDQWVYSKKQEDNCKVMVIEQ